MHPVLLMMMRLLKSMLLETEGQPVVGLAVVLPLLMVTRVVLPEHWWKSLKHLIRCLMT